MPKETKPNTEYDDLLTEIRKNFQYSVDSFREIRDQAQIDMRFISGDGWDPTERAKRENKEQPRPCLDCDELGQYVNQTINDVRESPRSIKVIPTGAGSNDKTAELRANKIRNIEYDSSAQAAYVTAFENAVQRGYGWARVNTGPAADGDSKKKLVIRRIANPDCVYPDPDFREADGSDMSWLFVVDYIPRAAFMALWPQSKIGDFSKEMLAQAPRWINDKMVQVAEYWRCGSSEATEFVLSDGRTVSFEEAGGGAHVVEKRQSKRRKVTQCITNGFEILEKPRDWPGKFIPVALCVGRELWLDDGGGSKRIWESLIRHARGPQQLYNYYRTTQAEVVRMTPKTPFVGAEGQFEGHEGEWQSVNDTPRAFIQYKAVAKDSPSGPQPLPPPARPAYEPPIQPLEAGAQAARQAIQAAMGIMPLPTQAQRQNEKSGIALEKIKQETQKGSYHFVDNYERFLMHCGRILNDLLPQVYDTERDEAITLPDGSHKIVRIHGAVLDDNGSPVLVNGQKQMLTWGDGEHDVTISTGPSYESERDEANQFADMFFQTIATLPVDPAIKAKLIADTLRLKDLGPIGDSMAETISPKQQGQIPPQAQAMIQQLQQKIQLGEATIAQLMQEKTGKMAELANDLVIAKENNATKIAIAEIETKAQQLSERLAALNEARADMHDAAHDVGMAQLEHQQTLAQAQQAARLTPPATPGANPGAQQ